MARRLYLLLQKRDADESILKAGLRAAFLVDDWSAPGCVRYLVDVEKFSIRPVVSPLVLLVVEV